MNPTPIEWTDYSANPIKYRDADGRVVWGCVHASPGCVNCYAETLAKRYGRGGPFTAPAQAKLTPYFCDKEARSMLTLKPAAGHRCFVGDMTDVFGEWVPDGLLDRLFAVFALRPDVTWQVLTKRAQRMRDYVGHASGGPGQSRLHDAIQYTMDTLPQSLYEQHPGIRPYLWPLPNVWLGVSAEDQKRFDERIPFLLQAPASVRFMSLEPLLGPLEFSDVSGRADAVAQLGRRALDGIDWVIAGGESGSGKAPRPCAMEWLERVVGQCRAARVPVFVKQLGSYVVSEARTAPYDPAIFSGPREAYAKFLAPSGEVWAWRAGLKHKKGGDMSEFPETLRVREFPAVRA